MSVVEELIIILGISLDIFAVMECKSRAKATAGILRDSGGRAGACSGNRRFHFRAPVQKHGKRGGSFPGAGHCGCNLPLPGRQAVSESLAE